jgi:hypothetical protein
MSDAISREVEQRGGQAEPPGLVLAGVVAAACGGLLISLDRCPLDLGWGSAERLIGLIVSGIALLSALAVWAIKALYYVGRERRWSWKFVTVPALVLVAVLAGMVIQPPEFESARVEMEQKAIEMLNGGPQVQQNIHFERLSVSLVQRQGSQVYFYDADTAGGPKRSGWVYSPGSAPPDQQDRTFQQLTPNWYSFEFTTS